jgi:pyruvate dehydrogenase E1 component alpha subunit
MLNKDLLAEIYRQIFTIRAFETRCIRLYRQGLIRGYFHPYLGEEAIAVGVCAALRKQDFIVSTHRGHGHCIARGASLSRMIAELFGRETGYSRGRGGSMHIADVTAGNLGANGIVGGGIPLGVGAALGSWIRGEDTVTVIFFSDGASNNGVFAESLNLAAIWHLAVVFVIENNQYASQTPVERVTRTDSLYKRGEGYGVASWGIDGNDVAEVYEKAVEAVDLCRKGDGPVLIEAKTYRHMGHHVNDPGAYMPADKVAYYKKHDPLPICRAYLLEQAEEAEIKKIEEAVERKIEEAVEFAQESPKPAVTEFLQEIETY